MVILKGRLWSSPRGLKARRLSLLLLACALSLHDRGLPAQVVLADTQARIDRGLSYLCRTQREDGSWADRVGRKVHYKYVGRVAPHVGVTALAGLSLLASCVPDIERALPSHLRAVRKAAGYVASQTRADGFVSANGSRMYSHAFATIFLSRLCRADPIWTNSRIKKCLQLAVTLIVDTQNAEGGWRYLPGATDSDLSVTACQLIALEEARRAGMEIPETVLTQGTLYVRDCIVKTGSGAGAFRYQPNTATSRMSFTLTACGLTVLSAMGHVEDSIVLYQGLEYLARQRPDRKTASQGFSYYYGHYYAAQAALRARDLGRNLYNSIERDIVVLQEQDGRWTDWVGSNYATAVATLILQSPRLAGLASEDARERLGPPTERPPR